jgi:hypothetical protein
MHKTKPTNEDTVLQDTCGMESFKSKPNSRTKTKLSILISTSRERML